VGAAERLSGQYRRDVESAGPHRLDAQKKTPVALERDRPEVQVKRDAFIAQQPQLDVSRLIFIDESGFRLGSPPRYGWAPRGQDSVGKTVEGQWQTMTMIGALALEGFRGFMTVDAGTAADVFRAFVEQQLVPHLRDGDMVVMDNLSAHRDADAIAAIQACGAKVLFLPPYSPEFNPIEKAWAKIKDALRRLTTRTREAFDAAVATAMAAISPDDVRAWTAYSGYSVPPV
jgi:transposase